MKLILYVLYEKLGNRSFLNLLGCMRNNSLKSRRGGGVKAAENKQFHGAGKPLNTNSFSAPREVSISW